MEREVEEGIQKGTAKTNNHLRGMYGNLKQKKFPKMYTYMMVI